MLEIKINAEHLFTLSSKQDLINKVPYILPEKTRAGEELIWVDNNNDVFELGLDFLVAEKINSYPCKVYRPQSVSSNPKNK